MWTKWALTIHFTIRILKSFHDKLRIAEQIFFTALKSSLQFLYEVCECSQFLECWKSGHTYNVQYMYMYIALTCTWTKGWSSIVLAKSWPASFPPWTFRVPVILGTADLQLVQYRLFGKLPAGLLPNSDHPCSTESVAEDAFARYILVSRMHIWHLCLSQLTMWTILHV